MSMSTDHKDVKTCMTNAKDTRFQVTMLEIFDLPKKLNSNLINQAVQLN